METPARWLALGDSYTIGEGVPHDTRWPELVAARLRASGKRVAPPRIVATTGWTCEDLLAGMEADGVWPGRESYALVSLLIGVNDQFQGRTPAEGRFAECLERAVALAGGEPARVLWIAFPDWGVTPFAHGRDRAAIAREVDAWNAHERSLAEAAGVHTASVTELSRAHSAKPRFLAADGLHPGAAAHAAWAEYLAPFAERALGATAAARS